MILLKTFFVVALLLKSMGCVTTKLTKEGANVALIDKIHSAEVKQCDRQKKPFIAIMHHDHPRNLNEIDTVNSRELLANMLRNIAAEEGASVAVTDFLVKPFDMQTVNEMRMDPAARQDPTLSAVARAVAREVSLEPNGGSFLDKLKLNEAIFMSAHGYICPRDTSEKLRLITPTPEIQNK